MQAVSFGYGQGYVGLVYLFKTCLVAELRSAYKALDGCIRGSPIPWQVAYAGKSRLSLSRLLWGQTFSKAVAMRGASCDSLIQSSMHYGLFRLLSRQ